METKEIIFPKGWEVKEVTGNRIILMEKENELPKTWNECHDLLECLSLCDECPENNIPVELTEPMQALCQLLICRNAWWKQLGWKPDWNSEDEKYCIECQCGEIACNEYASTNKVLTFPTPRIRDQFLESFRDLIEEAKELL